MEVLIDFCCSFLDLLELLYVFFFSPLASLPDYVFSHMGISGAAPGLVIEGIISGLIRIVPGIGSMSLAALFLGSGLLFVLLWRFVKFLVGLFS